MKYYLSILLSICFLSGFSQTNTNIQKFVNTSGFENASIGVCISDLTTGREIASFNKNMALTPASTLKIVTTATALEILGEDYQFKTSLAQGKNNPQQLIIRGYGDPTLGSEHIDVSPSDFVQLWINIIKQHTDTLKPLNIEIDDSYFGYKGVSSKWLEEDMGNYFAAGAYGISIFDNTYRLYFNTMDGEAPPQIVKTVPEMKDIAFLNTLELNTTGKDNGYINGEPFSNKRKLVGDIPTKRKSFSIKGDIPDPGLFLGQTLAEACNANNLLVENFSTVRKNYFKNNSILKNIFKTEETELFTHLSPPLKDIIRIVNVKSNNHYTEHLIRAIGKSGGEIPFYSDVLGEGIAITKKFWADKGLDTKALFMYDGCGLAPSNRISPALLCDILTYMHNKSNHKDTFLASLPKSGKEGTVKNILKGTRLEGKLSLKSGSIANVQCFAGYYMEDNKKYVFSVMVNNYTNERRDVVKAIETLLLSVLK